MRKNEAIWSAAVLMLLASSTLAQDTQSISVPFSDPSRPGVLRVEQTHGSIRVEAYDGAEVQFEARVRVDEEDGSDEESAVQDGLRPWGGQSVQMEVIEENNFMRAEVATSWSKIVDLTIRVPRRTDLQLECVHSGDLHVRGVAGELELANTHGSIEALDIDGSVVAETTHGDVEVSFAGVAPGQPMAFSSFHGDVDATFPADLRAEVRIDPGNGGEVYTSFDIQRVAQPAEIREERDGRRYKVTVERETRGTINGGGPEMRFKTWRGSIFIRKRGT